MDSKTYIVELDAVNGEGTVVHLADDGEPVNSLFAVVSISNGGASIVDNCYRSIAEAQKSWPEAIPPKPYHLSHDAIKGNFTIRGETPNAKLT